MNQINHSQFAHLRTPRHERAPPAGAQPRIRPAVGAGDLPAPAAPAVVGSPAPECAQVPPAVREMKRVLDAPPALAPSVLRGDTWLTRPWRHGPLHAALPPIRGHVVMTYYAHPHDITWRSGRQRLSGRTRPGTVTLIPKGRDGRWDIEGPIEVSHVYVNHERLQASADPLTDGKTVELLTRAATAACRPSACSSRLWSST